MPKAPTLLCLNDNETALWIRKLVLEQEGFRVVTATQAAEALKILREHSVYLVIADHILQDTTGAEVTKEMKNIRPGLPVILLSGNVERPAGSEHVDAFVSKGEGREALLTKISELLAGSKHRGPNSTPDAA